MPRPNKDRVMVSFYISRTTQATINALAERLGQSKADTYRQLLSDGLKRAPKS